MLKLTWHELEKQPAWWVEDMIVYFFIKAKAEEAEAKKQKNTSSRQNNSR